MSTKRKKRGWVSYLLLYGVTVILSVYFFKMEINKQHQTSYVTLFNEQKEVSSDWWTLPVEQTMGHLKKPQKLYKLINPSSKPLHVSFYLANKETLQQSYSYVNTELHVYQIENQETVSPQLLSTIPLTLEKNKASFTFSKGTYLITLEKGVFYTVNEKPRVFPDYAVSFKRK